MKRLIPRKFDRTRILGEVAVRPQFAGPPIAAMVLDLAQSGMAFFSHQGLPVGELVEVAFRLHKQGVEKRDARVVRIRVLADGNIVGVTFARPLKFAELKALKTDWVRS